MKETFSRDPKNIKTVFYKQLSKNVAAASFSYASCSEQVLKSFPFLLPLQ